MRTPSRSRRTPSRSRKDAPPYQRPVCEAAQHMRAIGGAALLALILLQRLAGVEAVCLESGSLVRFGLGNQKLFTATSKDGQYRADADNTFNLQATCEVSGAGASLEPNRWRAQLTLCGTTPCRDSNMPALSEARSVCTPGSAFSGSCALLPSGKANFTASTGAAANEYSAAFSTRIDSAWKGATTFYYLKCWYLCEGKGQQAEERSAASFTLEAPLVSSPPPRPPPPPPGPPPPPPAATFFGTSTATIDSPNKDRLYGLIYAPRNNIVQATATCVVLGDYALLDPKNWPAQLITCGTPAGAGACSSTAFNSQVETLQPVSVKKTGNQYTATYEIEVDNALFSGQQVTYRYFTCLYKDERGVSKRAGASLDVIATPAPPPRPRNKVTTAPPPRPPRIVRPTAPQTPPPGKTASGWGDPHFEGFDGVRFSYHGQPNNWYQLLVAPRQAFSLQTRFVAGRLPGTTVMRAFEFKNGADVISVTLAGHTSPLPPARRLSASANGSPVIAGIAKLKSGTSIEFVPGSKGGHGRVVIEAGFIRIAIIHKWRPNRNALAEFLDFNLSIQQQLRLPVTGLLARSYTAVVLKKKPQGSSDTAGAAAVVAAPALSASSTSEEP